MSLLFLALHITTRTHGSLPTACIHVPLKPLDQQLCPFITQTLLLPWSAVTLYSQFFFFFFFFFLSFIYFTSFGEKDKADINSLRWSAPVGLEPAYTRMWVARSTTVLRTPTKRQLYWWQKLRQLGNICSTVSYNVLLSFSFLHSFYS